MPKQDRQLDPRLKIEGDPMEAIDRLLGVAPRRERRGRPLDGLMGRLTEIDFTFPDSPRNRRTLQGFHAYPARFVPEIPRTFIDLLPPPPGTGVYDPFGGCGTTLVEAQAAGYKSACTELNPIGCLIARVKTRPRPDGLMAAARSVVAAARLSSEPRPGDIPRLDHWFKPVVADAVARLLGAIRSEGREDVREAMELALSSILVRVSNQDSDTRYAAVEKGVGADDVLDGFADAAAALGEVLRPASDGLPSARVLQRDTLDTSAADLPFPVGLVVTSPPYPNAYEYWLYHKYRMYWLGHDPLAVKEREIGARAHFFGSEERRAREDFGAQMGQTFGLLADAVVPGGHCCFVVGNSKIRGEIIDNAAILKDVAHDAGFQIIHEADREIGRTRTSFNPKVGRIRRESVLVWRRR